MHSQAEPGNETKKPSALANHGMSLFSVFTRGGEGVLSSPSPRVRRDSVEHPHRNLLVHATRRHTATGHSRRLFIFGLLGNHDFGGQHEASN
jgi:hypothetical protein